MNRTRTENRNGYDIHIKAVLVHQGGAVSPERNASASGYVSLVKIDRDVETYVEWHRPNLCRPRGTREEAEEDALQYAFRLVDRRPFDGPPPGMPLAA